MKKAAHLALLAVLVLAATAELGLAAAKEPKPGRKSAPTADPPAAAAAEEPVTTAGLTAEQILRKADQLEKDGRLSRAADLYQEFLAAHGDHTQATEAEFRLARCLDGLGLIDEAIAHLEKVVQPAHTKFEHRPDACALLGKLYGSIKNYEKAVQVFDQMLSEGAGLYEEEILSVCGGYYAILKKYDEAAAKFNILKRRPGSPLAEQAACKLALLWLKAEQLDLAIAAVEDVANQFPKNDQYRGLMVQIADLLRKQGKYDKAIAVCEQVAARFGKTPEALAAKYLVGQCLRDQKKFQKAAEVLEQVGRAVDFRSTGLPAEGMFAAAEVWFGDLADPDKALPRYEDAVRLAKESASERMARILEQCYFRLAEYHYTQKHWSVALEYYQLLRATGAQVNVLGRILKCQNELNIDVGRSLTAAEDVEAIKKKIADHPGTFLAAEAEVLLADRELAAALNRAATSCGSIAEKYLAVLKNYPKDVLGQDNLESYLYLQVGACYAQSEVRADLDQAIAYFEKALAADPAGVYKANALEGIAATADRAGSRPRAFDAYRQLFDLAAGKLDAGKTDADTQKEAAEYLRAMLSRADPKESVDGAIALARRIVAEKNAFSDVARNAQFYIGELYFLKKDFSAAAAEFKRFVQMYGPRQDAAGNVVDPPWKPASVDDRVLQVYEAAVRVAHSWYLQGNNANMIQAYQGLVRNLNYQNKYVAEAQYWLAIELGKTTDKDKVEKKRQVAEALWKNVVNPGYDFDSPNFAKRYHFWVREPSMQEYVQLAALRSGQLFSEAGDHELAAGIFAQYLDLFGGSGGRKRGPRETDDNLSIARYALGREYLALGQFRKAMDGYLPYLYGLRDDRFRVSALQILAYHAGNEKEYDLAAEAYAALLDEYGENGKDAKGSPIPVPQKDRIRQGAAHLTGAGKRLEGKAQNWDGLRMPVPADLDLGEVRYHLGYLYWKQEDWPRCIKVLAPFVDEASLQKSRSRAKALYMAAQSCFRVYDSKNGLRIVRRLIHDHPNFEAIEEAYVYAARGCVEAAEWAEFQHLYKTFVETWPQAGNRPHMDLYAALAMIGEGRTDAGTGRLRSLAAADTLEDVKADANYHLGRRMLADEQAARFDEAMKYLETSVNLYPREAACLAAARCAMKLQQWERARAYLSRVVRDFPAGDPNVVGEAKTLLPEVLKQITVKR